MNNTTDMDPEKAFWVEPWDNSLQNSFVAIIGLAMFLVLVAFLWKCCDWVEEKPNPNIPKQSFPLTPVYAHELEPGLVVLQSQDGEFFRILQEYDANKTCNGRTNPAAACADPPIGETTIQYIPQYTRPFYQNQPTAPPARPDTDRLIDAPIPSTPPVPPPYSQY
ncbi:uncharacterized protein LOC110457316 [Mizuhopecten yessoensis]|uniref:Uncharacterized protein n=1 Tax=Mizuhopecten yessoensis TaxID=6573 RepID=A0A210Q964_MIZYE|nr:uncharacterized protein LOC110457316 [Mizuhopecten yessoensis]OWF45219.1 hypothetical protein KP79_PYT01596 [Mizuhopecten yessoensis]